MTKHEKLLPGCFYHIYNRGNNKENLFLEEKNYPYFLALWEKHTGCIAETYAYALLRNHFHFLVRIKEEAQLEEILPKKANLSNQLSKRLSNFFNAYAKAINKNYERTGSLFQERFKRKLVDSNAYLAVLIYYIHLNPQRHGLIADFSAYPHTSFGCMTLHNTPVLESKKVIDWFGGEEMYLRYHHRQWDLEHDKALFLEKASDD